MKAKKVMALVLCAAMVSGLAATTVMAAPEDQFEGLTANEAYEFPMMVKSFQATYWEAAMKGMDKAAEELGVTYTAQGPNSESDIADQVNMINTAIAANPVGLGLAACDTSSVQEALQTCVDKGIPVVTFDTGIADAPEGSVVCEVCTDNNQAGSVAAENMYPAIKDVIANADGQVIIGEVNQDATGLNIQQRGTGFINKMIELIKADGKTVAVKGNEFYVNAAEGADAEEADADVVIQVAVPAQTTVELCSTEAHAFRRKEALIICIYSGWEIFRFLCHLTDFCKSIFIIIFMTNRLDHPKSHDILQITESSCIAALICKVHLATLLGAVSFFSFNSHQ